MPYTEVIKTFCIANVTNKKKKAILFFAIRAKILVDCPLSLFEDSAVCLLLGFPLIVYVYDLALLLIQETTNMTFGIISKMVNAAKFTQKYLTKLYQY